jgi:hypothetical protein
MDVPIASTVREVPTARLKRPFSPGMQRTQNEYFWTAESLGKPLILPPFAFHTSLPADSRKLGPLAAKVLGMQKLMAASSARLREHSATPNDSCTFQHPPICTALFSSGLHDPAPLPSRPPYTTLHHSRSTATAPMSSSVSAKSEPALVVEQPDARRVQAQVSRLQMGHGLKKAFGSDGESHPLADI